MNWTRLFVAAIPCRLAAPSHSVITLLHTICHIFSHGLICCRVSDGGRLLQHVSQRGHAVVCHRSAATFIYLYRVRFLLSRAGNEVSTSSYS